MFHKHFLFIFQALYNALKYEDEKVREAVYVGTQLFDEHPLMYRSFKEVIWGYHDPLLNVTKVIDPDWFYTDYIGFFMNVSPFITVHGAHWFRSSLWFESYTGLA